MSGGNREATRVLYIMGQDRSGSTVLGDALGQAEGVAHLGETRNVWRAGLLRVGICGCGRQVRGCPVWSAATAEALGNQADPSQVVEWLAASLRLRHLGSYLSPPGGEPPPESVSLARILARLYRALFRLTEARVIVDSSKHPAYGALLATLPDLDVRFVHLVRDPRATAYSWAREKPSPGRPGDRMWRAPAWRAARAWVLANLASDRVRASYPTRSMLLRYEDAMGNPAAGLARMLRHAGQAASDVSLDGRRTAELHPQHTAAGNPVRLEVGPVELREDDAWRRGQRRRDRLVVMALTAPFLRRYGYPMSGSEDDRR